MTTRLPNLQCLVGKTIQSIQDGSVNIKTITFTDGTVVLLEADRANSLISGIFAYSVEPEIIKNAAHNA